MNNFLLSWKHWNPHRAPSVPSNPRTTSCGPSKLIKHASMPSTTTGTFWRMALAPLHTATTWVGGVNITHSHSVVRATMKVNGRGGNLTPRHPKTPLLMVTKICIGNYVGDVYHHAKFYPNRFRGFGSAHAWFRAPRHKVGYFFGSWERLQPRRVHRF